MLCGGNDAFRRDYAGSAADAVDAELAAIFEALQAVGAQLATIGIFDVSYSPAVPQRYRPELRQRLALLADHARALAARFDCVHVDLSRHRRASDPTLYSPDGRHGNARSDAIAAAEMVRALGARLAGPAAADRSGGSVGDDGEAVHQRAVAHVHDRTAAGKAHPEFAAALPVPEQVGPVAARHPVLDDLAGVPCR